MSDEEEEPLVLGRKRQRADDQDLKKPNKKTKKGSAKGKKNVAKRKKSGSIGGGSSLRDSSVSMFSGMRKVRAVKEEEADEEWKDRECVIEQKRGGVRKQSGEERGKFTEDYKNADAQDAVEKYDARDKDEKDKEKDDEGVRNDEKFGDRNPEREEDARRVDDEEGSTEKGKSRSKAFQMGGIRLKGSTKENNKSLIGPRQLGKSNASKTEKPKTVNLKDSNILYQQHELVPTWKAGDPVPYRCLAQTFSKVEAISGRLEIQAILTQLFLAILKTTPDDLVPTIYLCIKKLAPAHKGIEIGVGEGALMKALSLATGVKLADVRKKYKEIGDLGDVAAKVRTTQRTLFKPPPLTVRKLYNEFLEIAEFSGNKTLSMKTGKITKLLAASIKEEAKYIARALQGKLRIHLADKTVIIALASAVTLWSIEEGHLDVNGEKIALDKDGNKSKKRVARDNAKLSQSIKDASRRLTSVYNQLPVWDEIVPALVEYRQIDEKLSERCKLAPGVPVAPMLAKPTKAVAEVLEKFDSNFTCEYKYDGERAQIHRLEDGTINIFSRNAEDLTTKYPDLVQAVPKAIKNDHSKTSFIIDAEAVAYDVSEKKIKPFQELQGRKRKNVDVETLKIRVCVFAFDLLYFDGKSLLQTPFHERREKLRASFSMREGEFMFAQGSDCKTADEITTLLNESVKLGCEGLMVKALSGINSTYEPANRCQNWLKVKKDYLEGLGDTLDLVPIGGYRGRGKRSNVYGAFLLACYNSTDEEYQSVCKLGTGFSDDDLKNITEYFDKTEDGSRLIDKPKSYYRLPLNNNLIPDQWFDVCQVWEVKCADLSISPAHTGAFGMVETGKGIGLRFPRFLRIRDDKQVEDATSAEQVVELYKKQSAIGNNEYEGCGDVASKAVK